ncbi:MAG: hypothetical protein WDO18_16760 [Acidobacteriota bacterium]
MLEAAEALHFDVLLTVDQNIPAQQNLTSRRISIVILCAPTNRLQHLSALIPSVLKTFESIGPGTVTRVRLEGKDDQK